MNAPPYPLPVINIRTDNTDYVRVKFDNLDINKFYLGYSGHNDPKYIAYKVKSKTGTHVVLQDTATNVDSTIPRAAIDGFLDLYTRRPASTGGYRKTRKHRRAKRKATRRNRRSTRK
jgi:hypothetical protein